MTLDKQFNLNLILAILEKEVEQVCQSTLPLPSFSPLYHSFLSPGGLVPGEISRVSVSAGNKMQMRAS